MKKTWISLSASIALALGAAAAQAVPTSADVVFVVDESGSMGGEHAWLGSGVAGSLDSGLAGAGVTTRNYGLTGFGGHVSGQVPHKHSVGGGDFGTATEFSTATGTLVTSGATEDGWNGIDYALNNYTFSGGATNIILVTDEDRDNQNGALTYNSVLGELKSASALLNAVVNVSFECGDGSTALGISSGGKGYVADGSGGFTQCSGASAVSGFGSSIADYVDLALATGGAAWDLNQLRAGGLTADSFTSAFVSIKVREIVTPNVPEPASLALLGAGLAAAGATARKKKAKKQ